MESEHVRPRASLSKDVLEHALLEIFWNVLKIKTLLCNLLQSEKCI